MSVDDQRPWYYRWSFTNWLIAKPWTWNFRMMYQAHRQPSERWPDRYPGENPLRAAWHALTFPHVHHHSEDNDEDTTGP